MTYFYNIKYRPLAMSHIGSLVSEETFRLDSVTDRPIQAQLEELYTDKLEDGYHLAYTEFPHLTLSSTYSP